jgi:hypothetical protein
VSASISLEFEGIRTALLRPTLISKVSRQAGSIVRGCQSRAGDPKNGPAAGSGYVLWSRGKVKAHRLRQNQDARAGQTRKQAPVEGLKVHGRTARGLLQVLRQTSGALRQTEGKRRRFAASSPVVLG